MINLSEGINKGQKLDCITHTDAEVRYKFPSLFWSTLICGIGNKIKVLGPSKDRSWEIIRRDALQIKSKK